VAWEESVERKHRKAIDSQPKRRCYYNAKLKCNMKHLSESEGRKVLIEVRDNRSLAEGSLPALVRISKQGKTS
jgi:hypothetical protein